MLNINQLIKERESVMMARAEMDHLIQAMEVVINYRTASNGNSSANNHGPESKLPRMIVKGNRVQGKFWQRIIPLALKATGQTTALPIAAWLREQYPHRAERFTRMNVEQALTRFRKIVKAEKAEGGNASEEKIKTKTGKSPTKGGRVSGGFWAEALPKALKATGSTKPLDLTGYLNKTYKRHFSKKQISGALERAKRSGLISSARKGRD